MFVIISDLMMGLEICGGVIMHSFWIPTARKRLLKSYKFVTNVNCNRSMLQPL